MEGKEMLGMWDPAGVMKSSTYSRRSRSGRSYGGGPKKSGLSRIIHRNKIEVVAAALGVDDLTTEERQQIRHYVLDREDDLIAEAIQHLRPVADV